MFKVEFIDQRNSQVFREKTFKRATEMHEFIKKFQLIEGKEFSFFTEHYRKLSAVYVSMTSFTVNKCMGFRMYFDILNEE